MTNKEKKSRDILEFKKDLRQNLDKKSKSKNNKHKEKYRSNFPIQLPSIDIIPHLYI